MRSLITCLWLILVPAGAAAVGGGSEPEAGMVNPGTHDQPAWFKTSFLDIREDVAEAAEAGRRVALYFYQDGCPYCAKLLREGFGDRALASMTRAHFDVIAINLWGDREVTGFDGQATTEKAFGAALGVQYTPTLLLLDEQAQVVLRINGYFPPHRLGLALRYVGERRDQAGERFQDFARAQSPPEASGKLRSEGGFLAPPWRLADQRAASDRPLLILFEQSVCAACDELHDDILEREPVVYSLSAFDAAVLDRYSTEIVQAPDGRELSIRDWADDLGIAFTPSLVFFDSDGREVFRADAYLKAFHVHGALDYVATGAYLRQPSFQRWLQHRREALSARGRDVDLME